MDKNSTILVTGKTGMVGGALVKELQARGYTNVLAPSRKELNLLSESDVLKYFKEHKPEFIFMVAAKVGGIAANMKDKYGFFSDNIAISTNLFAAALEVQPKKSLFLGSSCIYPRECQQPIKEEYFLSGPLEPTNEGYALAKIGGLRMAQYLHQEKGLLTVCPMPCNMYGTGDHFDLDKAHVLSSLVKRFVDAKASNAPTVTLWGDGSARREFMHVDDMVRAMFFFMENVTTSEIINVGCGTDVTIKELANLIRSAVGFNGEILWDTTKPNGMLRKCMDVTKLKSLGFKAEVTLDEGIKRTVAEYRALSGIQ